MSSNRGATSLPRSRKRSTDPMADYDRLPADLRRWLANATLPWRPGSVVKAHRKALAQTRDPHEALRALDQLEARLIAKDARQVWGDAHPAAA